MLNRPDQRIIIALGEEVYTERPIPPEILIGVRMLAQAGQDGEEAALIPLKAAPGVEVDVGLSIRLARCDCKERLRNGAGIFHVGEEIILPRPILPKLFGLFRSKFIFHFYNLPIAPNRGYAVLAKLEYQ